MVDLRDGLDGYTVSFVGGPKVRGLPARLDEGVARALCGALFASPLPIWAFTATSVDGSNLALDTPHGAWAAVLYCGLLATLALAASIPHRRLVGKWPSPTPAEQIR